MNKRKIVQKSNDYRFGFAVHVIPRTKPNAHLLPQNLWVSRIAICW
jgi:hypothetical protein